jgi:hypothetical protein
MAKESFNWKSLFINDEGSSLNPTPNEEIKNPIISKGENKFPSPTSENKFPETTTFTQPANTTSNPFINEILEVYNKGFEGLNSDGFDFFEMYKSVMAVGTSNPQSYQMAFTMGKTIKPDLTKDFLIEKSKFYISEIEKVYAKYDATGNSKNKDLSNNISAQKSNLSKSIADLESQITRLQSDLESQKIQLAKIDSDNLEMFTQIQLKIDANNIAKQKILESINTVITGINQYL